MKVRARAGSAAFVALLGLAIATGTAAVAQTTGGWIVEVIGGPVTPSNPSVTVRVSAQYPTGALSFASGWFDLMSSDREGVFSSIFLPAPIGPLPPGGYGCFVMRSGLLVSGSVHQAAFGQIDIVGCGAHPANPLSVWEARWTTQDFRARDVALMTMATEAFTVHVDSLGGTRNLVALGLFHHGSAVIEVRPSNCYADCDALGTGYRSLDIFDYLCFQNRFAARDPYACDCDTSTGQGVCDIFDFLCFRNAFDAGCP